MNVSCPQCKTVFRVDPRKVPSGGVRARCSVCGGVFEVASGDERPAGAPVGVGGPAPAVDVPAAPPNPAAPAPSMPAAAPSAPAPMHAPEPEPADIAAPAGQPFGQADPDARARRLARALISDLAAYNPERQERGLREGRLKELFQEDLKKSWQEYVDQVGVDLAKRTPYFRDALNEFLAKGSRVF